MTNIALHCTCTVFIINVFLSKTDLSVPEQQSESLFIVRRPGLPAGLSSFKAQMEKP